MTKLQTLCFVIFCIAQGVSLVQGGGPPDLASLPQLVQLLLGLLLQRPNVRHRHPVPLVSPAEQLKQLDCQSHDIQCAVHSIV